MAKRGRPKKLENYSLQELSLLQTKVRNAKLRAVDIERKRVRAEVMAMIHAGGFGKWEDVIR
jgi:hypothetical protein